MNPQAYKVTRKEKILRWFDPVYLENRAWNLIGDHTTGNNDIPLSWTHSPHWKSKGGAEYVMGFCNDSFEIGIGFPDQWLALIDRPMFHKMIIWYLWQYAKEWFGLRRKIWYWFLHRSCERNKIWSKKTIGTSTQSTI